MSCFQIEVRGVTFTIWAPTIQDALETFMIDMEFYEVPKEMLRLLMLMKRMKIIFSPLSAADFN